MKHMFAVIAMVVAPVALAQPVLEKDGESEWHREQARQAEELQQNQHLAAAAETSGVQFRSIQEPLSQWDSSAEPFQSQLQEEGWQWESLNTSEEEFEYHRSRRDLGLDPRMSW